MSIQRKVFVAIPVHDGTLRVGTVISLIHSVMEGQYLGVEFNVQCWVGDSLLPHARNTLIAQFMASDCDDMVFIDADISWAPGTLIKLLHYPVDFVAGAYRFKSDDEGYPLRWLQEENTVNEMGLVEMKGVPTGFLRMTRAGLERVTKAYEHKTYEARNAPGVKTWCLFDLEYKDGNFYGEDYVFCDRLRELGEKIYLDPNMAITHSGNKEYVGHLGGFINDQIKKVDDAKKNATEQEFRDKFANARDVFSSEKYEKLFAAALGEAA